MKKRLGPVLGAVVLLLMYGGYRLYVAYRPYEWSGTIEARTISVGSRAGGRVKEVLCKEGDRVTANQPILVLEPGDLRAQLLQAQGQLAQAQANLEKIERGARPEEIAQARARALNAEAVFAQTRSGARREQVGAAQARLAAQEASLQKAREDQGRFRTLLAQGAAAQADFDAADAAFRSAQAQRDALRNSFDELKNGARSEELTQAAAKAAEAKASEKLVIAGSRVEDINAAKGLADAAQGRLDAIQVMLDELTVRAPRTARIESLDLRPGDILAPSQVAATLLEDDQLYVRIYVPETHLGHIHPGLEVPITVDSFPKSPFRGVVEHVSSVGEYSPRNLQTADERADQVFAARIGLRTGLDKLRAGMAAFIQVPK